MNIQRDALYFLIAKWAAAAKCCQEAGFDGVELHLAHDFQEVLATPIVLTGFGLPDDSAHAPNEKRHVPTFYRGVETLIYYSILSTIPRE